MHCLREKGLKLIKIAYLVDLLEFNYSLLLIIILYYSLLKYFFMSTRDNPSWFLQMASPLEERLQTQRLALIKISKIYYRQ